MEIYDVAVLGAGPGGYEAAIRSAQYGLKTALIEARELGGTCLNRGCIPTKALLHCAEVYEQARAASVFGVHAPEVTFDYGAMAKYREKVVRRLRSGIAGLEKAHGVTVVPGFGRLKSPSVLEIQTPDGSQLLEAKRIILATGSAPSLPPIPGIDGDHIVTSDEVLGFSECPQSLVIIGGGVIGVEFATLYSSLGVPVTLLEMLPSILPGIDADLSAQLAASLQKKGVQIHTGARVTQLTGGESVAVSYELDGQSHTATGQYCAVCIGRRPMTSDIGLDQAGVSVERGYIPVDDSMRTNVENIFAIGDITGKLQLAHVASAQGMVAAACCAGRTERMSYDASPACIYSQPEIATVGLSLSAAQERGFSASSGSFPVAANGKAMTMNESMGCARIVFDQATGKVLGAQIMAPRATDMIAEIAAVIHMGGTVDQLAKTIHPHPTVSEILMESAHDAEGMCCHLPPKKS